MFAIAVGASVAGLFGAIQALPNAVETRELAPGVRYEFRRVDDPRPLSVHAVLVDSRQPGIGFRVSGPLPDWKDGEQETRRETTRQFLRAARSAGVPMVVAVNGDAFGPWPAPFNEETPCDLQGLAIADGVLVSSPAGTPSLMVFGDGRLAIGITTAETDLSGVVQAISGFSLCLKDGRAQPGRSDLHPRTGLGLSEDGRWLVIVVIDGRQPGSHGATTEELGRWLRDLGASDGINMDGGGSSTLVWWDESAANRSRARLLNRPVGAGGNFVAIPPQLFFPSERTVGNSLGVVLEPADSTEEGRAAPVGEIR